MLVVYFKILCTTEILFFFFFFFYIISLHIDIIIEEQHGPIKMTTFCLQLDYITVCIFYVTRDILHMRNMLWAWEMGAHFIPEPYIKIEFLFLSQHPHPIINIVSEFT